MVEIVLGLLITDRIGIYCLIKQRKQDETLNSFGFICSDSDIRSIKVLFDHVSIDICTLYLSKEHCFSERG